MLLSEVLPEYHFRERHERRLDVPAEGVFAAIRSVTLAETPTARRLMRLRGLRAGSVRPLVEEMDDEGFAQIAEEPLREVVYAAIGQPWKPLGGKRADAHDFGRIRRARLREAGVQLPTRGRCALDGDPRAAHRRA